MNVNSYIYVDIIYKALSYNFFIYFSADDKLVGPIYNVKLCRFDRKQIFKNNLPLRADNQLCETICYILYFVYCRVSELKEELTMKIIEIWFMKNCFRLTIL